MRTIPGFITRVSFACACVVSILCSLSARGDFFGGILGCILVGTDGPDLLHGTDQKDIFYGNDGSDVITAGGGDDEIVAGGGDDMIIPGQGDDDVNCGPGDDLVGVNLGDGEVGNGKSERIDGGDGNDHVIFDFNGNQNWILCQQAPNHFVMIDPNGASFDLISIEQVLVNNQIVPLNNLPPCHP